MEVNWQGPYSVTLNDVEREVHSSKEARNEYSRSLWSTVDGRGLSQTRACPRRIAWLKGAAQVSWLSDGEFIKMIQVRSGSLPTPARCARWAADNGATNGRTTSPGFCSQSQCGANAPANLGHISQVCPATHRLRCKRHDNIASYIAKGLTESGWRVREEPRLINVNGSGGWLKPDLIVSRGNRGLFRDVQVSSDGFTMEEPYLAKRRKYADPGYANAIAETIVFEIGERDIHGLILNWRGDWYVKSWELLRELGLTSGKRIVCSVKAITWTYCMFKSYTQTGACPV